MSEYQHQKVEKSDGVARITFDRPKHNVLDIKMMNELNAELEGLGSDDELKCLVLNGAGASFCAGVEVADHKPENVAKMIETFNRVFELIDRLEVPADDRQLPGFWKVREHLLDDQRVRRLHPVVVVTGQRQSRGRRQCEGTQNDQTAHEADELHAGSPCALEVRCRGDGRETS